MISKFFLDKLSADKLSVVTTVAKNLSIDPNWLLAVMYFESGRTFSPSKTNSIGSVGLIQFTMDKAGVNYKTIGGVRYLLTDIAKMSFSEQMGLVQKYYEEVIKMIKQVPTSFIDTYLVTFFPLAVNKPDSFVFQTKGLSASLIAKQNPIFAKDGVVTKLNVVNMFKKWYGSIFPEIESKKKCPICHK